MGVGAHRSHSWQFLPWRGLHRLGGSALPSPRTGSQWEGQGLPVGEVRSRAWWTAPCSSLRRVLPVGSEGSASGVWLQRLGTPLSRRGTAERGNPSFQGGDSCLRCLLAHGCVKSNPPITSLSVTSVLLWPPSTYLVCVLIYLECK